MVSDEYTLTSQPCYCTLVLSPSSFVWSFREIVRSNRLSRNYAELSVIEMVTMVAFNLPLFLLSQDFLVVASLLALLQYQYTDCVISTDPTYRDSSLDD